jgi:hypothetical protein
MASAKSIGKKTKRKASPKKMTKQKTSNKRYESTQIEVPHSYAIKTVDSQIFDRGQEKIDQLTADKVK